MTTTNRKRRAHARARANKQRKQRLLIAAGAALAAVAFLIVAGAIFRGREDVTTSATAQRDGRILGAATAPVIIETWEDFQCPVCKTANATVVERLIEEYVETGKAQLRFRYFSFIGPESQWAAAAAESAAEQGKFWEYHDALFSAQDGENRGAFAKDRLKQIAVELGLDMTAFNAAFDSGKYESVIDAEHAEGRDLGVEGTPTFFVNGSRVLDWRDYDAFKALIESQVRNAQ
jgi:protein-disulfide isomerase